ncbi:VWA domain-containing protein [Sphingomonas sp. 7/4-4]|uniref:vWA domain-containing protein n=1 Tax=Sphingomonas sp. 7/4-4 TaxID=3018446 RepID=UPI0022F3E83C|nr:VWA domain-containing protein [Sphingomonas sp. 7/4-4]WBY06690.1 VWA domain-containing protein [Sphingomonas sp. 7/4-4]
MSRYYLLIAGGLSAVLLASCTGSAVEEAAAPPAPAEEVVVTGYKANGIASEQRARTADMAQYAPAPEPVSAPAPPPPSIVVTGSKMSAGAYAPSLERRPFPGTYQDVGRDKFTSVAENPFKVAREEPVSTFSIDVDTASYSFVRASLNGNVLPQPAAVRTEEMINYFPYDYVGARSADQPFSTNVAVFPSPWTQGRKLVRIGIRGYEIQRATRPRANLVFLIDTSGSMNAPNKLPLVKQSLSMLLDQLSGDDRVAIVTYAGSAGTALEPTRASEKGKILAVLDRLGAGGSTAGAEGIRQAYALAEQNLDPQGVNRVILATDGDFNVGITNQEELKGFVERERGKGVFLSVLGFGMGNYNDALMQTLAQNGNGAAAYIDTVSEARKTLVDEATSTLFPIAKDVKIQVEFNPATVAEYRLIGYETRMLAREDFDNDKVDAGDVGSGQTVTALYEVVPVGGPRAIGDLRYSTPAAQPRVAIAGEYGFVKIRYKTPKANTSRLISTPISRAVEVARFEDAPRDARFATGVAGFAELLRGGKYSGTMSYDDVLRIALAARGDDGFGYRSEFVQLVRQAKTAASLARVGR